MKKVINKITVIAHDNYGAREIFNTLTDMYPNIQFQLGITTGLYYKKTFFQSVFKMLKEASFKFCFGRFIDLIIYKFKGYDIYDVSKKNNVITFETNDINDNYSIDLIKKFLPDLIISTFTMHIVGKEVINLSKINSIGVHPSILPSYRGLEVFFWQLANNEKISGVSVFLLDIKIDNGKVFLQNIFEIDENETVESLYSKITNISARLLIESIEIFNNKDELNFIKSSVKESYFPMPTTKAYNEFLLKGKKWK